MCRWGCLKTDTTYRCKFCGIRYCINCLCGDFPGKMYAPNLCRRCNQKNHRGQKVNCDDAFSEAAQKVITMQNVIKAAKGGDRNKSYLRLPIKSKGANNTTTASSKSDDDGEKKEDSKSKNKINVLEAKSKIDTGNYYKEGQVVQQKAKTAADDSKATKPAKKLKKKKSSRKSITAQSKSVNTTDTAQKVVKKVKSKVTSKEGATKTTVKKKKQVAA